MIQRVQTLLLLAIVIIGVILFFIPVLQFTSYESADVQQMYELTALELEDVTPYTISTPDSVPSLNGLWGLTLTTALIPLLALVDIFLYRKRLLQARLNIFLACLCLGYYAVLFTFAWFGKTNLQCDWSICFGACLPLVCLVLTLMATRRILKDEALVRSADRLR